MGSNNPMLLNHKNYHSLEANCEFMSRSQYLDFLSCEAAAMAYLAGRWTVEETTPLLVGSYVHSWNNGTQREFVSEHPEMFTKQGGLRAEFKQAEKMISALENDPLAVYMLEGQKEVIFTAEFAGARWRVMVDSYRPEKHRMVDLKTTRSIREYVWSDELRARVSFIEMYNYPLQAALYAEIERLANGRPEEDWFDFYAVAVSKENVPDKEIIDLRDPGRYAEELEKVKINMPRILAVKKGQEEPFRCERCDYCRSTKQLRGSVYYAEL